MNEYFEKLGYKVTSPRGFRTHPITGKKKYHAGVDLVLKDKAPIKAFTGGKVVHASYARDGSGLGDMGNTVCVVDKAGATHVYAHLDVVSVRVGSEIDKDTIVGLQGNTGASAGSHLHYEIRKNSDAYFGYDVDREASTYEPAVYLGKLILDKPASSPTTPKQPKKAEEGSKSSEERHHIVRVGETLSEIAKKYSTTVDALAKVNKLKDADKISIGQKIKLP